MTLELSHIAIASPQLGQVADRLRALSLEVEKPHDIVSEKVRVAMVPVKVSDQFRIELLEPLGENSPISKFLDKRPNGGMHHLCFQVSQLERWQEKLIKDGFIVLPPGIRKAARGRALFIHPKSMGGVLVELEESLESDAV